MQTEQHNLSSPTIVFHGQSQTGERASCLGPPTIPSLHRKRRLTPGKSSCEFFSCRIAEKLPLILYSAVGNESLSFLPSGVSFSLSLFLSSTHTPCFVLVDRFRGVYVVVKTDNLPCLIKFPFQGKKPPPIQSVRGVSSVVYVCVCDVPCP